MCGIFGHLGKKEVREKEVIKALFHRGPDDHKVFTHCLEEKKLTFIQTRLSIFDLESRACAPMHDPETGNVLLYNGEIYNFKELRVLLENEGSIFRTTSDTEVLLKGYGKWEEGILDKIEGMFAFAIWDERKQRLIVGRDHLGIKPLYWGKEGDEIFFSSEMKSLMASGVFRASLRQSTIDYYLRYGQTHIQESFLERVELFPPAHYAIVKNGEISFKRYWNPHIAPMDLSFSYEDCLEKTREMVRRCVEMQMRSDVEVGVFLSGGIDSSILLAEASKVNSSLKAFSLGGFKGREDLDETPIAAKVAKKFKAQHIVLSPTKDDFLQQLENFVVALDIPSLDGPNSFFVSQLASQYVKVALSGLGGDEVFGGYPIFLQAYRNKRLSQLLKNGLKGLPRPVRVKLNKLFLSDKLSHIIDDYQSMRAIGKGRYFKDQLGGEFLQQKLSEWGITNQSHLLTVLSALELTNYLQGTLLRDVDSVSMFSSLEVRVPFLDHTLIEKVLSFPEEYRLQSFKTKAILKDAYREVLPQEVLFGKKRGFSIPLGDWLKQSWDTGLKEILPLEQAEKDRRFQKEWRKFQKSSDHYHGVWKYLILYKWMQNNGLELPENSLYPAHL